MSWDFLVGAKATFELIATSGLASQVADPSLTHSLQTRSLAPEMTARLGVPLMGFPHTSQETNH